MYLNWVKRAIKKDKLASFVFILFPMILVFMSNITYFVGDYDLLCEIQTIFATITALGSIYILIFGIGLFIYIPICISKKHYNGLVVVKVGLVILLISGLISGALRSRAFKQAEMLKEEVILKIKQYKDENGRLPYNLNEMGVEVCDTGLCSRKNFKYYISPDGTDFTVYIPEKDD